MATTEDNGGTMVIPKATEPHPDDGDGTKHRRGQHAATVADAVTGALS